MTGRYTALLDTSVVIDLEQIDERLLEKAVGVPASMFRPGISAVTMAELAVGPLSTNDQTERAIRQARLQWVESVFDAIPFDTDTARSYGIVAALVISSGRKPRKRLADRRPGEAHQDHLDLTEPADAPMAGLDPRRTRGRARVATVATPSSAGGVPRSAERRA